MTLTIAAARDTKRKRAKPDAMRSVPRRSGRCEATDRYRMAGWSRSRLRRRGSCVRVGSLAFLRLGNWLGQPDVFPTSAQLPAGGGRRASAQVSQGTVDTPIFWSHFG